MVSVVPGWKSCAALLLLPIHIINLREISQMILTCTNSVTFRAPCRIQQRIRVMLESCNIYVLNVKLQYNASQLTLTQY